MANFYQAHATYNNSRVTAAETAKNEVFSEPVLWKILLLIALTYIVWSDKVSIILGPVSIGDTVEQSTDNQTKASFFDFFAKSKKERKKRPEVQVTLLPDALNNVTFAIDYGFAQRNGVQKSEVENRLIKCRDYVERFAPVAIEEMKKHGVPVSVTLAQALLESDAGESKLACKTNNHFGIKCFSKRCKRGHCANFTDDSHKDFFVKYGNAGSSFKAHSKFLKNSKRYRHLFDLEKTDYRNWARGLAKAGYATDKKYGEKLIAVIQSMGLEKYDNQ